MPIEVTSEIQVFNQVEFHALNAKLLRIIFDVHNEFGRFLDVNLYREAIAHFFGGAERCIGVVPVYSGERLLGRQAAHFLTQDTAFALTALPRNRAAMEDHQRRFLRHTPLKFIQWVNFNRHNIEFTTLTK